MNSEPYVTVAANNLSVTVSSRKTGEARILDSVSFVAEPAQITAIMGPSGSGKTTMLNALANRLPKNITVTGDIYFNGHGDQTQSVKEFSGYVMQEDAFIESLTVEETIRFSAKLHLRHHSRSEVQARVEHVIAAMNLGSCRKTQIGGTDSKGLSGGEKKRVSIAVAMLANPAILFLDEPTSGLDASLAYDVVLAFSALALEDNRNIICSIHQPRSQVFALFDRLILLREGKIVYNGPAKRAAEYFESLGFPCPDGFNPSDFFLDMLAPEKALEVGIQDIESNLPFRAHMDPERAEGLAADFQTSQFAEIQAERRREIISKPEPLPQPPRRDYSWFRACLILAHRELLNEFRSPGNLLGNMAVAIFMSILAITLWWQLDAPRTDMTDPMDPCDATTLHNWQAGFMQLVNAIMFTGMEGSFRVIKRRVITNREANAEAYNRAVATVGYFIADGVHHYLGNFVQFFIVYFGIGAISSAPVVWKTLFLLLFTKFAVWGYFIFVGTISSFFDMAGALSPLGTVLFVLTAGFVLSDDQVPVGLIWIQGISPARYGFHGTIALQLEDSNYIEQCVGFSPQPVGNYFLYLFLIGLGWRLLAGLMQQIYLTHVGLQS